MIMPDGKLNRETYPSKDRQMEVLYICDRRACDRCSAEMTGCNLTKDIRHAVNFHLDMGGNMVENNNAKVIANLYDRETIIENCTVQILENTTTGEVSVGWWKGSAEDSPGGNHAQEL